MSQAASENNLEVKGKLQTHWLLSLAGRCLSRALSPAGWGSWRQQPEGRERKNKHLGGSCLQRGENARSVQRGICFVFHIAFSSLGTGDYSPARSPSPEASPQGQWGEHGSSSSWQADRAKCQCWCHDQESDSSCLRYPSLYQHEGAAPPGLPGGWGEPGSQAL